MIVDMLQDLFRLLISDPSAAERFAEDPESVLAEVGLGECELADLADALPIAAAELPEADAAAIIARCGPVESWSDHTVSEVLVRVVHEPEPAPSWVDQVHDPVVVDPVVVVDHPDVVVEPPVVIVEPPVVIVEPPVVIVEPPVVIVEPPVVIVEPPVVIVEPPVVIVEPPVVIVEPPVVVVDPPVDPPVITDPPEAELDPPVITDPPEAELDPPVITDPPEAELDPPVVTDPPPAEEFVDIKAALAAAREAIADGDPVALAEALESANPADREQIAAGLLGEVEIEGLPADDPIRAALEDQLAGTGEAEEQGDPADPADPAPTGDDPDIDPGAAADEQADADAAADAAAAAEIQQAADKIEAILADGDLAGAGAVIDSLPPELRQAALDQILADEDLDPTIGALIGGLDGTEADSGAALADIRAGAAEGRIADDGQPADDLPEKTAPPAVEDVAVPGAPVELDQDEIDRKFGIEPGDDDPGAGSAGDVAPTPQVPVAPAIPSTDAVPTDGDGAPSVPATPVVAVPGNGAAPDAEAPVVAVPGNGAAPDAEAPVVAVPGNGATPVVEAPAVPATPVAEAPDDVDLDFGAGEVDSGAPGGATGGTEGGGARVGGEDFFGDPGEPGAVIPIDEPPVVEEPDDGGFPDATVGGEDFFGGEDATSAPPDDDGGLTPEQLLELEQIELEAGQAIIDNFD